MMFIQGVRRTAAEYAEADSYLHEIRAIETLAELSFHKPVTFFIGENGAGKSTLLEAIAVNAGFNAEGGTRNFSFSSNDTHSGLHNYITSIKGPVRPKDGFFLRAESFYNVASYIDSIDEDGSLAPSYGGRSLHAQSHGESFLSLVLNRFSGRGLYLLDEPEAALSPSRQLSLLCRIHDLVEAGSQFLIATHSPILMAYPDAELYLLDENGINQTRYKDTEHYIVTSRFLGNPERMLRTLFGEEK